MSDPNYTLDKRVSALERAMWPERFCNHEWVNGPVPCPDDKPGCLVAHYGQRCAKCGTVRP